MARRIRGELQEQIAGFEQSHGFVPSLKVLLVGEDEASTLYSESIVRWFKKLGLACSLTALARTSSTDDVTREVRAVSHDPTTHGLLIQMPLPAHIDSHEVLWSLAPHKDVEGLHPVNAGLLASGVPRLVPSTPLAAMELLDSYDVPLAGREAVILGRSNVVGKPLAQLLLARDCTVTVLHSRSRDAERHVCRADIVAAAVGTPGLVRGSMLKPGAVVLDFGINFVEGVLVGDVAYSECAEVASLITPVPGGIGPLTNVMLARNLLQAATLSVQV